ncbi:IS200/IS605 family transposase [Algoriphagus sp. AGSA1]|uniref:IS200/IS605 family transposase n=1 Tax=Algoriphagus sp. AGSA1 TaxID=2907213 RepID=UPI001F208A54|nr:IS200/IS605 family transposase [Algoriphagus sp. AGSA1]MCE7058014.1 IS200/IS605 family transposase [Algoriphagus sp. AGSA1]
MPNTYTQIHIHLIFAVKFRKSQIQPSWKERLHQYLTGMIQANKHKVLQIESMPDHIHILFGMRPDQSLSSLIQNVKTESSKWINANKLSSSKFHWQDGFGAFSYSKSQLPQVIRYIQNQEEHHSKKTFNEEYKSILDAFDLEWDEKYIFHELL